MDKSSGSLVIKFSGKESLNLNVLTKLCSCLTTVLNKITITTSNSKSEYSVGYNSGDGFALTIKRDSCDDDTIMEDNVNVFNALIDIFSIRKFVTKTGEFSVDIIDGLANLTSELDSDSFDALSYSIYSSDNLIEDNLSKLSSMIMGKKNSFVAIYKNGILEKRVSYSKEDIENSARKINLEELTCSKEEYHSVMALQVEQLDLSGSGSWKFKDVYNAKNTFKAKIKDRDFSKDLKTGNVVIGYGLILKGNVKTTIIKDKFGKIIPNKSTYVIEKVNDVFYADQVDTTTLVLE